MKTIIQLSDFHVNTSFPMPEDDNVFKGLIAELKKQDLGMNPILVYNGDVIDQTDINLKIELVEESKKPAARYNEMVKQYDHAERYFNYLINELGLAKENVIICCGNHDVFFNSFPTSTEVSLTECPKKDKAHYYSDRFKLFNSFCEKITGRRNASETIILRRNGINFLVVNSNWMDKWDASKQQHPLCINCKSMKNVIEGNRGRLLNTKMESKLLNVFVAHAPMGDYCEFGVSEYPENNYESPWKDVNYFFGLKLYGDKHTSTENQFDYIVGARLHDKYTTKITYALHQFDNSNKYHHKSVIFENDSWKTVSSEDDISQILAISEPSIKPRALEYLFGNRDTSEIALKVAHLTETRSSDNWAHLDKLLRSSADIRIPQKGCSGIAVSCKRDGFINTLTNIVGDSSKRICVTIKGDPRLGKSVCLSVLYMNMLFGFSSHSFEYLPVYLDVERILNVCIMTSREIGTNRDNEKVSKAFAKYVSDFLTNAVTCAEEISRPICCIIDGLSKHYLYEKNRIESTLDELINTPEMVKKIQRIVYCIDTIEYDRLGRTPQDATDSEYVVYFNRVLSRVGTSNWKAKALIQAYASLQGGTKEQARNALKNITNLNIFQIDTNFLVHFWDALKEDNCGDYYFLLDTFAKSKWPASNKRKSISSACFNYIVQKCPYSEIHSNVNNEDFDTIRTERNLIEYLIARNYTRAIEKHDYTNPVLNRLYGYNICLLIRAEINNSALGAQMIRFAHHILNNGNESILSSKGISTLVYLLGRTCKEEPGLNRILTGLENKLSVLCSTNDPEQGNYSDIARRSITITRIVSENSTKLLNDYINTLIANDSEKSVNRMFYLQFYGDRMGSDGAHFEQNLIKDGFDFFRSFHILTSRATAAMTSKDRYPLLELELFTLCDMVLLRLDNRYATRYAITEQKEIVESIFYNKNYNKPRDELSLRIISKIIELAGQYLRLFAPSNSNDFFESYLKMCIALFDEACEKMKDGPLQEKDIFVPNSILKHLMELKSVSRIGWHMESTPTKKIPQDQIDELQSRPMIESTEEHIYEAYLIGLFFLPDRSTESDEYDKQKILNILLIHDLGEAEVKDLHPQFEDYDERREQESAFVKWLFLQSAHVGISNLADYYTMWENWCNQSDYNSRVAKEIDVVHRLFKMMILSKKGQLVFNQERAMEFWKEHTTLKTREAKIIFNTIISSDPQFIEASKCLGLDIPHYC